MANQFISNSTVTYDIAVDGTTTVTHDITLQNTTSDFYATSYTLSLTGINPINPVATDQGENLQVKVTADKDTTSLQVYFPDAVVGSGSKRRFTISFTDKSLVARTGEIWEITVPKLADSSTFDFYSTVLKVPKSFGNLAYMSPDASTKSEENGPPGGEARKLVYFFNKEASLKTAITAAFGNFQVFSFNINYHLENTLNYTVTTSIALPPDTSYQKMNYTKITPRPNKITIDKDGNWIAVYTLKAQEKMNVVASGAVQIFSSARAYPKTDYSNVTNNLNQTDLWQTNDPKIKSLASKLKTPQAIYDYVTSTLTYDYARVSPNVSRLGAAGALANPKEAICTEFTDLFIALARAAGIPAREIEGFAYTENPQIQPLSLVADVLHAWPEYWDKDKQVWIPVDPTWGSTSGIDYFSKLDLRHFAFAIHGLDSKKPYPAGSYKIGSNPQKDVNVTFGSLPTNRVSSLSVHNKVLSQFPFSDEIVSTDIENDGPIAVYDENLKVYFNRNSLNKNLNIPVIPPFGDYEATINVPYSFLGQKTPQQVEVNLNDARKSEFDTYKVFVTVSNLLLLCIFIFFVVFVVYLAFRDANKAKKHTT